ncbi:hypothetical protein POTOM_015795 [Populus tomentosa]|uniref:Uncharacterized protein n=1 Tax=Populus tomentosa TaxID=118781 RepID=A0A8X8A2I3_POPTO|nr:hypothetical protein POTOM_015795 [Populus tomentosa]
MKMLFSIEERQIYSTKYVASKEICDQSFCVGSSHGYTISINCETELPAKDTFLGRTRDDMDSGDATQACADIAAGMKLQ